MSEVRKSVHTTYAVSLPLSESVSDKITDMSEVDREYERLLPQAMKLIRKAGYSRDANAQGVVGSDLRSMEFTATERKGTLAPPPPQGEG